MNQVRYRLLLRGTQTYTGDTEVRDGILLLAARSDGTAAALNGSVVLAGGQFGGAGSVNGNISGHGVYGATNASRGVIPFNKLDTFIAMTKSRGDSLTEGNLEEYEYLAHKYRWRI